MAYDPYLRVDYTMVLTIVVKPCLLGFDVTSYWTRIYVTGFTQGQGFVRSHGIFSHTDLFRHLIWTEEPFRVLLK